MLKPLSVRGVRLGGVGWLVRQGSSLTMRPASVDTVVKYLAKPLKIHYLQMHAGGEG